MEALFGKIERKLRATPFWFVCVSIKKVVPTVLPNIQWYTYVIFELSRANHPVACCYMQVRANNANNNNRHIHLAFPASNWNSVNSNVMELVTPKSDPKDNSKTSFFIVNFHHFVKCS